jgi:hypothetical protein
VPDVQAAWLASTRDWRNAAGHNSKEFVMPLDSTPNIADNIIKFDGTVGQAAKLNYSVPLPGRFTGRRAVLLNLGLVLSDWKPSATAAGFNVTDVIALAKIADDKYVFDRPKAIQIWIDHARASGVPGDQIEIVEKHRAQLELQYPPLPIEQDTRRDGVRKLRRKAMTRTPKAALSVKSLPPSGGPPVSLEPIPIPKEPILLVLQEYMATLGAGKLKLPKGTLSGGVVSVPAEPPSQAVPMLMLVEIYGVSSFLGDYGLGRTVKTFTLLPGESTTLSLKTWKSSEAKHADASTIIDSFQSKAADKFRAAVQRETTDRTLIDTTTSGPPAGTPPSTTAPPFRLDSLGIDLLFGAVKVEASGGYGTETHSTRDDFKKTVTEQVQEHVCEASAKRDTTVTSSSEWSEKTAEEAVTERTIKNVNMRRVLNFVFRELNQEYLTKIHLKDIRIGFSNGKPFSYREIPLSGLRKLLQEVLVPAKVDPVAQQILKMIAVVFDKNDTAIPVLETLTMSANGQNWTIAAAAMTGNNYPAPSETMFYRFKRGALGQANSPNPVEGVLLDETTVTLRTDSVIVEALLGQADALDEYAMEMQRAEAEAKTLSNDREQLAQQALAAITDGKERAAAFTAMFRPAETALRIELVKGDGT